MVSYPLGANDSKSLTDGIGRILKSNLGYMDMMHMQKSKKHTACILSTDCDNVASACIGSCYVLIIQITA